METALILLLLSLGVGGLAWFIASRRLGNKKSQDHDNLKQLEEVVKSAQLTNDSFFRSLELVQKNLESLLSRAEAAEQRLRNLILQPGVERKEQYTAAALLLKKGQEPRRVASMLNLPLPQVQIVQELQKMAVKEKRPAPRPKRDEERLISKTPPPTKNAGPREKNAARTVPLVDVIKRVANGAVAHKEVQAGLGRITA